jgi:hypothetical protein
MVIRELPRDQPATALHEARGGDAAELRGVDMGEVRRRKRLAQATGLSP